MDFAELLLIAVGLSMDAFAVSVCKGLAVGKVRWKHLLSAGLWFGGFQALMPIAGYYIGKTFADVIKSFDHWVVFALLAGLGIHMVIGAFKEEKEHTSDFSHKTMLILAIATSIDAMAIGISLSIMKTGLWVNVRVIGAITFAMTAIGVVVGNKFGNKLGVKAELIGGFILIGVGLRVLIEHLVTGV